VAEDMAEERTEAASPRRREEARQEGRVARSVDLSAALALAGALATLGALGPLMANALVELARESLMGAGYSTFDSGRLHSLCFPALITVGLFLVIILAAFSATGFLSVFMQIGWLISPKALALQWERVNPISGLSRMLSWAGIGALVAGMLKLLAIGGLAYLFLSALAPDFSGLWRMDFRALLPYTQEKALALAWRLVLALVAAGAVDYLFQWWRHERSMRMSKQEVKEEMKQQDGDPKIKQRIRQIQRQRAMQRMMSEVPTATVVITNPTHVAVALRYTPGSAEAPVVVAKGERLIAARIKHLAQVHGVPVVEEPPLARALLRATQIGQQIPTAFYQAVAQVLALILRRKSAPTTPALSAYPEGVV